MRIMAMEQGERTIEAEGHGIQPIFFVRITFGTPDLDNLTTFTMFDETIERSNRRYNMFTAIAEFDSDEYRRFGEEED